MSKFLAEGHSISNLNKEKNGDSFYLKDLEEEGILIAIVADGVSQQPCDWLASDTVVEEVSKNFLDSENTNIKQRIAQSVDSANRTILQVGNNMASTLSLVVWPYHNDLFYICNIGDSRIYQVASNSIQCLVKDDAIIDKEVISSSRGVHIYKKLVLSQVMGQSGIKIQVESHRLNSREMILLASDGFYGALPGTFNKKIMDLNDSKTFHQAFKETVKKFELFRGDDLTVIAIKRIK